MEDFTTYTEADPNSRITVTADEVSYTDITRNEDAWVGDDKGVDHFAGDFTHLLEVEITGGANGGLVGCWALANSLDDLQNILDGSGDALVCFLQQVGGGQRIFLGEAQSGTLNTSSKAVISQGTTYWLEIERDEAASANGDLILRIYTDAARTNLLDTITLSLPAMIDFRYVYGVITRNTGDTSPISARTDQLDLQEGGASITPRADNQYYRRRVA